MSVSANTQEPRYESKFILSYEQALGLNRLLHTHPAHFRTIYPDRQINNTYFDTADFAHFRENVAGVSPRKKVRIRWYGDFEQKNLTVLEIKSKNGEVVSKSSVGIDAETRNISQLPAKVSGLFVEKSGIYHAVLRNSYLRQYFATADGKIRLTVDTDLKFGRPDNDEEPRPAKNLPHTIVELKYGLPDQETASQISRYFPFRLSKSSKYEMGVSTCYPHLVIV